MYGTGNYRADDHDNGYSEGPFQCEPLKYANIQIEYPCQEIWGRKERTKKVNGHSKH